MPFAGRRGANEDDRRRRRWRGGARRRFQSLTVFGLDYAKYLDSSMATESTKSAIDRLKHLPTACLRTRNSTTNVGACHTSPPMALRANRLPHQPGLLVLVVADAVIHKCSVHRSSVNSRKKSTGTHFFGQYHQRKHRAAQTQTCKDVKPPPRLFLKKSPTAVASTFKASLRASSPPTPPFLLLSFPLEGRPLSDLRQHSAPSNASEARGASFSQVLQRPMSSENVSAVWEVKPSVSSPASDSSTLGLHLHRRWL